MLIALRKLERLDKEEYTEEERTEAEETAETRRQEEANAEVSRNLRKPVHRFLSYRDWGGLGYHIGIGLSERDWDIREGWGIGIGVEDLVVFF